MKESDFASFTATAIQRRLLEKFRRKYGYGIARKGRSKGGDTRSESSPVNLPHFRAGEWLITFSERTRGLVITRADGADFQLDNLDKRIFMVWLHE